MRALARLRVARAARVFRALPLHGYAGIAAGLALRRARLTAAGRRPRISRPRFLILRLVLLRSPPRLGVARTASCLLAGSPKRNARIAAGLALRRAGLAASWLPGISSARLRGEEDAEQQETGQRGELMRHRGGVVVVGARRVKGTRVPRRSCADLCKSA